MEPGVENMLGHAPPPLTANGLDMRDGHPAEMEATEGSQARFSRPGALNGRGKKNKRKDQKRKSTGGIVILLFHPGQLVRVIKKGDDWAIVEVFDHAFDPPMHGWIMVGASQPIRRTGTWLRGMSSIGSSGPSRDADRLKVRIMDFLTGRVRESDRLSQKTNRNHTSSPNARDCHVDFFGIFPKRSSNSLNEGEPFLHPSWTDATIVAFCASYPPLSALAC